MQPGPGLRQRLAAILAADAAGYSRLMAADERATVEALDAARAVFRQHIEAVHGRMGLPEQPPSLRLAPPRPPRAHAL